MTESAGPLTAADIAANLASVRELIDEACRRSGREPAEVRLLPVSKTMPAEAVMAAHDAGYRRFGENRVQEAQAKATTLADVPGLEWAIIGHLQTNKTKNVAEFATELQSLDSLEVATELQKRLDRNDRTMTVLVQVNSSDEPQKFGLHPDAVAQFTRALRPLDRLRVRGLMTLAVFSDDAERVGECFRRTVAVQRALRDLDGGGWDELSMGMTGDFELAIAHGATCVRVGRAIFGARLDAAHYWPGAAGTG